MTTRTHKIKVEQANRNLSADAIRQGKCSSSKAHNATIKAERIAATAERKEAHDKLSLSDKVAALDARLGKGVGAVKQRAKLAKKIEEKG